MGEEERGLRGLRGDGFKALKLRGHQIHLEVPAASMGPASSGKNISDERELDTQWEGAGDGGRDLPGWGCGC